VKNRVTDSAEFDTDVVFMMWLLCVVLQLMLKLWLIRILKFWCFIITQTIRLDKKW